MRAVLDFLPCLNQLILSAALFSIWYLYHILGLWVSTLSKQVIALTKQLTEFQAMSMPWALEFPFLPVPRVTISVEQLEAMLTDDENIKCVSPCVGGPMMRMHTLPRRLVLFAADRKPAEKAGPFPVLIGNYGAMIFAEDGTPTFVETKPEPVESAKGLLS